MIVRPADQRDAAGLGEVHVTAWRAAYRGLIPDVVLDGLDVAERAALWRTWLAPAEPGRVAPSRLVAVADGSAGAHAVLGFVVFGPPHPELSAGMPDDTGQLWALNVRPEHWGRGVGRALIAAAEHGLREAGSARAVLWVVEGNARARAVYEHLGWRPDGARMHERYGEADVPELRYAKELGSPPGAPAR